MAKKSQTKNKIPSFVKTSDIATRNDPQTLETIREQLRIARDAELRISDLASVMREENENLNRLRFSTLPELFAAAGVDQLGLPSEGNSPAYDCKLRPFYKANIAASWSEERREAAFKELERRGAGDLIKTTFTVYLSRTDRAKAKQVSAALKKLKVDWDVSLSVHSSTLTAYVREQIEERQETLPLETLGASVGLIVEMKERKK